MGLINDLPINDVYRSPPPRTRVAGTRPIGEHTGFGITIGYDGG